MTVFRKHWPLLAAVAILGTAIAVLLISSLGRNEGHLVYVLDDPYIHMAMAKNLVRHGVWGINQQGFSSTSSSPVWTLLISLSYVIFGVNEIGPFALALLSAIVLVWVAYRILREYEVRSIFILGLLLALVFFTPLPRLVFSGQEHILHALVTILFVYHAARALAARSAPLRRLGPLFFFAFVLIIIRYEGLFVILLVGLLLVIRRRWLPSLGVLVMGLLPVAVYGLISLSRGWYFLPNPVFQKGKWPDLSAGISLASFFQYLGRTISEGLGQLSGEWHLLALILVALSILILNRMTRSRWWVEEQIALIIFLPVALLHALFARIGWFYRYEAYLVALGLLVIILGFRKHLSITRSGVKTPGSLIKFVVIPMALAMFLLPLHSRSIESLQTALPASTNIYHQQYQMGLFLREFYNDGRVAANDIGAINYLSDVTCLDLFGLGSMESVRLYRAGEFSLESIRQLAGYRKIQIAIVYHHWYRWCGGLPDTWRRTGQWKIPHNIVCGGGFPGGDVVTFYAVDPAEGENLIQNLKAYSTCLPTGIVQLGEYTMP